MKEQSPIRCIHDTSIRRANQDNSPRIHRNAGYEHQRLGNVAGARKTVGSTVKPKREKDATYHREKMLLCKQEEAGIQLNAEQADWKDDTDDEFDNQELEAHYMYMAKLQQVSPDAVDSGPIFDTEPEQKVQNDDHYDVFAIECQHPEQSESVCKTYLTEQDAHNVVIESEDMNYDSEQTDQNDENADLAKERELLASLIEKLKCEIDESKTRNTFLEASNKVLVEKLKSEIEDFKNKNKSLKEANNKLSEEHDLFYADFKKSKAELKRRDSINQGKKQEVEDHRRSVKLSKNKTSVTECNNNLNAKTLNVKYVSAVCDKCVSIDKHAMCVLKSVAKPLKETVASESIKNPRNFTRKLYERVSVPLCQILQCLLILLQLVKIVLFIVDSGCSKHMTKNLKLLINFVEKFLGTVKFGNDQIAPILGYGDLVQGAVTIKRVYYVEGLNHNLFSVGQFCDADLEVAFKKLTCFIRDLNGNDLLTKSNKKPINNVRKLYEHLRKIYKWSYIKFTPSGYMWKPKSPTGNVNPNLIEIILFIVDSGYSKHMTGNLKLLINFVEKCRGTVKFGNDQIASILGYGDLVQGAITIKRVYYVEGLNHNLFFAGQFCDADLEVAFRKSTCFIRDLKGNNLLTGSCGTNLYLITLQDTTCPNPICLMAKATSSQAWLWHHRLSHLNFDTINLLSKNDIVVGLPKLKFVKDHLCSSCELGKAKRKSFHSKLTPSSKRRYTWTHFLRSKDETPKVLIDFLRLVQRGLQAQVRVVRTDKGTEFLNQTLHAFFAAEGIQHQMSVARTPEQNGVVERRNHTLVEAARTMLSAAKGPLFFWAEAIATACFTQNRSLVIPRHVKTPYHIINDQKPSVKFFYIFGSVYYIVGDGENLDKMKEKGDECIFVGYSNQSRAYKVFNNKTRVIMESIHVNFDELPQMASDHISSDPAPTCQTMASYHISSDPAPTCQTMASDHISSDPASTCQTMVSDQNSSNPVPECQNMALEHNSLSLRRKCKENVSHGDKTVTRSNELDLLFSPMFDELLNGSSKVVSKSSAVTTADETRRQLESDPEMCMFALTVSRTEPKNIKEALADSA
nr:ribonuclease H-like domain-containing protein [Tanacetum cinerariifolium]